MRLLHYGLLVIALTLPGCAAEPSAQPDPAQSASSASGGSSSAQRSFAGLPAVAPMLGTGPLMPHANADAFTFVVFGDNRPAKGEPQPETIREIFTEINDLKPAFAMSLVSGGAGAPLIRGPWGFHHYLIFTVDGDRVSVKLVKLESAGASS